MILQALKDYYDRKPGLPREGFEEKEIPYIIVLDLNGKPVNIETTYEGQGKERRGKKFLVPQGVKKASGIASNLLWENPEYSLGIILRGKSIRVALQHEAFKKRINDLDAKEEPGLNAVKRFLDLPDKAAELEVFQEPWKQLCEESANLSFKLAGDSGIILERPSVREIIEKHYSLCTDEQAVCMITGEIDAVERLHPAIKGVWGAQTSGANIVSFNKDAFCSFGKSQGANAPVGKRTVFAYTTALNHLLARDSGQRIQAGDATTVFWAERSTELEEQFADFFSEPPKDDPDRNVRAVESLFSSVRSGVFHEEDDKNRFFVLGLAPNASRISIRFWIVDTVKAMAEKIAQHFIDLKIVHGPKDTDVLSLLRLLSSIALEGKLDNVPPNLAGDTMRAILAGLPYPLTLLQAAVRRNRAEQKVSYARAALVKACINRMTRKKNPHIKEELKMGLDPANMNTGYRLGRLFATFEKIQEEANPGINATIRDRFYGAASGTPSTVFANLMRLKNHHLAKMENTGRRIYFEKLIGEIVNDVDGKKGFPATLSLGDQGRFAIGYYHQRQEFFVKKDRDTTESKEV